MLSISPALRCEAEASAARAGLAAPRRGCLRVLHGELSRALTFGLFVARLKLLPRGPSRPAVGGLLRAWLGGFLPRTPLRPSCFCRAGPHAPWQTGSFGPGLASPRRTRFRVLYESPSRAPTFDHFVARPKLLLRGPSRPRLADSLEYGLGASRRGRLRVLYESPSRALSLGLFVARPKFLQRGPSRPAAGGLLRAWLVGFSPRTPLREPLSRALSRPLRCEAEVSAAGALAPRGWLAPSGLALWLLATDAFASFMLLPRGPARPAFRGHPQH